MHKYDGGPGRQGDKEHGKKSMCPRTKETVILDVSYSAAVARPPDELKKLCEPFGSNMMTTKTQLHP